MPISELYPRTDHHPHNKPHAHAVTFNRRQHNLVVAITGAANGIGHATAEYFINRGALVAALDVDGAGLKALQHAFPADVEIFQADVTDSFAMQRAFEELASVTGGRIDILVNNAGILEVGAFGDIPIERQRRVLDINLWGVLNTSWQALPYLKKSRRGRIVNVSSASALYGHPVLTTYAAAKAGVSNLTEGLHLGLQREGIRVSEVQPLYVQTSLTEGKIAEWDGMRETDISVKPEKVAVAIWRSAHGKRRHRRVGWQTKFLAVALRLTPNRMIELFIRRYLHVRK